MYYLRCTKINLNTVWEQENKEHPSKLSIMWKRIKPNQAKPNAMAPSSANNKVAHTYELSEKNKNILQMCLTPYCDQLLRSEIKSNDFQVKIQAETKWHLQSSTVNFGTKIIFQTTIISDYSTKIAPISISTHILDTTNLENVVSNVLLIVTTTKPNSRGKEIKLPICGNCIQEKKNQLW